VSNVAAASLGVTPTDSFSWDGLYAGNLFARPTATATIIVDGIGKIDVADGALSFELNDVSLTTKEAVRSIATGAASVGAPALASVVSDAYGHDSVAYSVSASMDLARISGHRDLDTSTREHIIYSQSGKFVDESTNAEPLQLAPFSAAFLGDSATYDAATGVIHVKGINFGAEHLGFFEELHAMLATLDAVQADSASPAVFSFTVSAYAALLEAVGGETSPEGMVASGVLANVVEKLAATMDKKFDGHALVTAVAVETRLEDTEVVVLPTGFKYTKGQFSMAAYASHHEKRGRSRRSETKSVYSTNDPSFNNKTNTSNPVQQCAQYSCSCWKPFAPGLVAPDNKTWDPATGCLPTGVCEYTPPGSKNTSEIDCGSVCVTNTQEWCNCSSPDFDASYLYPAALQRYECKSCNAGYTCEYGHCYLDTTFTSVFNAGLWLGLAGFAGFIGVWVSLHSIGAPKLGALGDGDEMNTKKLE
jgi:hypothetical protein